MALTDTIKQMQQMGYNESDIIKSLQTKGISSKEINDSMAQLKIKDAVTTSMQQDVYGNSQKGMEPSMMVMNDQSQDNQPEYTTQQNQMIDPQTGMPIDPQTGMPLNTQMIDPQTGMPISSLYNNPYDQQYSNQYPTQYSNDEITPNQDYNYQEPDIGGYSEEYAEEYVPEPESEEYNEEINEGDYIPEENYGLSTETISEITNQLIEEKLTKTNSEIKNITEVKELLKSKVDKIDERLHKIESIIDQLQSSLIRKSFEQTQNLQDIKTEMQDMQSSFSKVINPMIDTIRDTELTKQKSSYPRYYNSKKSYSSKSHKKKK